MWLISPFSVRRVSHSRLSVVFWLCACRICLIRVGVCSCAHRLRLVLGFSTFVGAWQLLVASVVCTTEECEAGMHAGAVLPSVAGGNHVFLDASAATDATTLTVVCLRLVQAFR
jgi:hypothetical protein